ncbi:MAG: hypothetical protein JWO77_1532 [Ilumatobacteraceae bacterium]|nr:hypothetical protein [Ilumatobacteraceae bacterium]
MAGASSYTPHAGRRIDSSGPWRVLDLGASVSLSCGPPTQELVFLGVQVRPRRDRTVLTADGAGLHLVPEGDAGAERTVVGWGQIAQLVSVRPPGLDTEVWHVERLDGSRLPVVSAPLPGGLRASQLRSIVQGIAVIPTRFGGPAVAVDGVVDTSPGRYARLTAPRRAPA